MPNFTDTEIERLFGSDDAENEERDRFLEYFYVNHAYESLRANLPIRILVGHKGVGKSALLRRAFLDDRQPGIFSIWLKPNEISPVLQEASREVDFIARIES